MTPFRPRKHLRTFIQIFTLFLSIQLGACSAANRFRADTETAFPSDPPKVTVTIHPTRTVSIPTSSPSPTATPSPSSTPSLTPTSLPVRIQRSNLAAVQEIGRIGRGKVVGMALPQDGKRLYVFYALGYAVYNSETDTEIEFIESDTPLYGGGITADGEILALFSPSLIQLRQISTGKNLHEIQTESDQAALSPNGQWLATFAFYRNHNDQLRVWKISEQPFLVEYPLDAAGVGNVVFSEDSSLLAVVDSDGQISVWSTTDQKQVLNLTLPGKPFLQSVAISADNHFLAVNKWRGYVYLVNLYDGELLSTLEGWHSPAFSPDSTHIVSGGEVYRIGETTDLNPWYYPSDKRNLSNPNEPSSRDQSIFSGVDNRLYSLSNSGTCKIEVWIDWNLENYIPLGPCWESAAISPDMRTIAYGNYRGRGMLQLIDSSGQKILKPQYLLGGKEIVFSPSGVMLATTFDFTRLIRVSDLKPAIELGGETELERFSYAFSADGASLAASSNREGITVWHTKNGVELYKIPIANPSDNPPSNIAFSPDGKWLVVSEDRTTFIRRAEDGSLLQRIPNKTGSMVPAFSPDGSILAVGSCGAIVLYETQNFTEIETISLDEDELYCVSALAFTPDGALLAGSSASRSGSIYVWDVSTFELARQLDDHFDTVNQLQFSSDGTILFSESQDGTMRFWGVR